jgi:hypothetical protein
MKTADKRWRAVLRLTAFGAVLVASVAFAVAERGHGQATRQGGPRVTTLRAGDDLQAALKSARFGDTIVLQAGATFTGPIILPFKGAGTGTDADYITIRTSEMSGIANDGDGIKPTLHARAMPKIVAPREKAGARY